MSWRSVLAWPDTHIPDQHDTAVSNLIDFAGEFQPDEIVLLGDLIDCPGPSRWTKGTAEEYQSDIQAECDDCVGILTRLRNVYSGPVSYIEGNHEARIRNYLRQYAPALSQLRDIRLDRLLSFGELEIDWKEQPYSLVGSDWLALHGDKPKVSAAFGGGSALRKTSRLNASVVQGHTHRLGIISDTCGYKSSDGVFRHTLTGFECGHLSDINKASYIPYGAANWQMGFGLIHYVPWSDKSQPEPVRVNDDGSFVVHGVDYFGESTNG